MIEVISVASEAYPLIKTGGLADVAGALPGALASAWRADAHAAPRLSGGDGRDRGRHGSLASYADFFGGPAQLVAGRAEGLDIIAINAPHLYDRPGNPYLGPDRQGLARQLAALRGARALRPTSSARGIDRRLPSADRPLPRLAGGASRRPTSRFNAPTRAKTVLTVHNIAFQGRFGWDIFNAAADRLPRGARRARSSITAASDYLKAGLQTADAADDGEPDLRARDQGHRPTAWASRACCNARPTC